MKARDSLHPHAWSNSLPPGSGASAFDLAMRRRLLRSLAQRGSSEVAVLIVPGVLCWVYGRDAPAAPMLVWWALFILLMLVLMALRRHMETEASVPDSVAVPRWERLFGWLALAVGAFWAAPIGIALHPGSSDFRLLLYLTLTAVLASATTFLAPLPGLFWRFFAALYLPLLGGVFWFFPTRWPYMLPLLLAFGAVIARHAAGGRRFVQLQARQERRRMRLAEQYRTAKEQAERALADKNRFIAMASHDLRQPLHAMALLTETARQRNRDPSLAPVLQDMHGCVRSLSFLFEALLDLSRLEDGSMRPRMESVSLDMLFGEVATVFTPQAAQSGLRLRCRAPLRGTAWVHADPALLRQMVFNLLHNALRYTREGGVLLGARRRGARWRIEVWDTGSGIAPQERARIFMPYARGRAGALVGGPGYGLGLATVALCAGSMGVEYGVDSVPGRGACFWLLVPAVPPRLHHGAPPPVDQDRPQAGPAHQLLAGECLVVDDDPQVRAALALLMQSWGLQVETVASGAQALQWLAQGGRPQAVLCDQRLQGGESGFAVLCAVLEHCGHARGVMLSAEHDSPQLRQAEEEGYLVLSKPVCPDLLHALLSRWLGEGAPSGAAQRAPQ